MLNKDMFIGVIPTGIRPIVDIGYIEGNEPKWKRLTIVCDFGSYRIGYALWLEIAWMKIQNHPLGGLWSQWFDSEFPDWRAYFDSVTLSKEIDDYAAANDEQGETSVTRECLVCGLSLEGKRADVKTCGPKCRKKLSRLSA